MNRVGTIRIPPFVSNAPLRVKIIFLVFLVSAFPIAHNIFLINENYRAVESFNEDVIIYSAINHLKSANQKALANLNLFLRSGAANDLRDYNNEVDSFMASLKIVETTAVDLEVRFLLHSIRNSFESQYEEAHVAIRTQLTGASDPFTSYFRAERIGRYLYGYLSSLMDRTLIVGTQTYRIRLAQATLIRIAAIFILIILIILDVFFGLLFSKYLTVPLRRLSAAAARMVEGELRVESIQIETADEVGILAKSFNTMNEHIVRLIDDLREKAELQKRLHRQELINARNEKLLKESEFLALQARINPHFLFNTLSTISRDVMLRDGTGAIALIDSLSSLLRYGLDMGSGISSLSTELEIVRKYAFIQKYRFQDRIHLEIDCRLENSASIRIPAFSIQPLVENAFIHGLEPKVGGGTIRVVAQKLGKVIKIRVEDDGIGIGHERMENIKKGRGSGEMGHVSSIGIANVQSRIRLFTGQARSFVIRNAKVTGTIVEITLKGDTE